jgi:hypothetical protein
MKKKQDNHPDFQGTMLVDGVEKQIAGWGKRDKNGNLFITGQVKEPYNPEPKQSRFKEINIKEVDIKDESIPF